MHRKLFKRMPIVATILACLLVASAGIIFLFVTPGVAQDDISAKVDRYIKDEMQKQQIPGLSLAVIKAGQIILAKGYGFANVEHQVPVKPESIFQSGSVGKQFTATAVMILVEEGKIKLDDSISKYLDNTPKSWKNITVRHLLTHTAGMIMYPKNLNLREDYTEDELLNHAASIPLNFQRLRFFGYMIMPAVCVSRCRTVIPFQLFGVLSRYLLMLSSSLILPSSTRIITAVAVNCLPTEPD